jgi:hypothetical protein
MRSTSPVTAKMMVAGSNATARCRGCFAPGLSVPLRFAGEVAEGEGIPQLAEIAGEIDAGRCRAREGMAGPTSRQSERNRFLDRTKKP